MLRTLAFLLAALAAPPARAADLPGWPPEARLGPFDFKAEAMTFAVLEAGTTPQLVVAENGNLRGFEVGESTAAERWQEKLKGRPAVFAIGAADADGDGDDELFIEVLPALEGRPQTWIARRRGALKVIQKSSMIARVMREPSGARRVLGQNLQEDSTRPTSPIFPVVAAKGRFELGPESDRSLGDAWLFGLTPIESSGTVTVCRDERLILTTPDGMWETDKDYAATPRRAQCPGDFCQFYPPIIASPDLSRLYVFHNVPAHGVLASQFGQFKTSEAYVLEVSSASLVEAAREPLNGYTADVALEPASAGRPARLWAAVVVPSKKTYLLRFALR